LFCSPQLPPCSSFSLYLSIIDCPFLCLTCLRWGHRNGRGWNVILEFHIMPLKDYFPLCCSLFYFLLNNWYWRGSFLIPPPSINHPSLYIQCFDSPNNYPPIS
jgi:hypothetical protein